MAASLHSQLAFSGGEFSPQLAARADHPKFQAACRQLQNMIAMRQGGATRRPGFIFKAKAKYQDTDVYEYATRLIKFQFSPTTSFILEFGHEYVRFYANKQQVIITNAPGWINGTNYAKGAFVKDPGDANATYYCIANIAPSVTQPHSDPAHWVKQDIYEVPSPYSARQFKGPSVYEIDVWKIAFCQINDVVYLAHPNYPPYKLTRNGDTDWVMQQVDFLTPAMLDENATGVFIGVIGGGGTTGAVTLSANAPEWAAATTYEIGQSVNPGGAVYTCIQAHKSGAVFAPDLANGYWKLETIFTAGNVGGYFQLGTRIDNQKVQQPLTGAGTSGTIEATGDCEFATYGSWAADATLERSDDNGATWYGVRTISSQSDHNGNIAIKIVGTALFRINVTNYSASTAGARAIFTVLAGVKYGVVKITGYANAYTASGVVISKLYNTNSTTIWSEGAWSDRRGYPQALTSFQARMIYGGSYYEPQRIWGTVTDDLENFDRGDSTLATDSFAFDLNAVGRGRIQWLIGNGGDLMVGFAGAEWIVNSGQGAYGGSNDPVTAQAINAGEHSAWGSEYGVLPALFGNSVLYTQRSAKTLQQMAFSVYTNKYGSTDLSMQSDHLFALGIAQIDYQPQFRNQNMVWVVTKAGSLCCMTYDQDMEVFAWARQISGWDENTKTIHFIESVAVLSGDGTEDDQVWIVVDRPSGRCIELMNPINWEQTGVPVAGLATPVAADAIYVDSSITVTDPVSNVIGGLDHLKTLSVVALLNGTTAIAPMVVANDGTITIPNYEPDLGDKLQIGLPIYYYVQPMPLDVDSKMGLIPFLFKAVARLYLRVVNSLSGRVQGNGKIIVPINYNKPSNGPVTGPSLFTGNKQVDIDGTPTDDATFIVHGSDPFPLTLLATTLKDGVTGRP